MFICDNIFFKLVLCDMLMSYRRNGTGNIYSTPTLMFAKLPRSNSQHGSPLLMEHGPTALPHQMVQGHTSDPSWTDQTSFLQGGDLDSEVP